ncbi:porin [Bartonella apis]|uniref:porin n=1 Tax=Bartonella apis TaxID=1686310 RepID=UPI00096A8EDA
MLQTENRIQQNSGYLCNVFGNDYYNISGTDSCIRNSGYLRSVVTAGDNVYLEKNPVCGMIAGHGLLTRACVFILIRKPKRGV